MKRNEKQNYILAFGGCFDNLHDYDCQKPELRGLQVV